MRNFQDTFETRMRSFISAFSVCMTVPLNNIAPIKKKYARGNQMPFMTKELSKEIMLRSRLRNKFLIDKTDENHFLYTQQEINVLLF